MAIYVESMSAPTAGSGIQTFIDAESWELVTIGTDDFHKPVAQRERLKNVFKEWRSNPDNVAYNGAELARLVLSNTPRANVPDDLMTLFNS
ncbi:MAG: hypothetical protein AB1817_01405 [Chloroflexota bacterium]